MGQVTDDRAGLAGPGGHQPASRDTEGGAAAGREPPAVSGVPDGPARPSGGHGPGAVRFLLAAAAALVLVVAGGSAGAAIALHYAGTTTAVTVSGAPAGQNAATAPAEQLAKVAAAAMPSVVTITVTTASGSGEGSGVILRSDGTIMTNNHVIEAASGGAGLIKVTFASGQSENAAIIGQDPAADIAVIRASGVSGAVPARLGPASGLHVGDSVLAVGSPLGLSGTVTSGIVSALHRSITAGSQGATEVLEDVIQTDTAINPGNSGGALVDGAGRVVGITTAIATVGGGYIGQQSGSIGVGFAIPVGTAYRVATQLLSR